MEKGTIISHYKILEKLGEGGMGVVYKAHDTKLERNVALKFLSSLSSAMEEETQRFIREAKSAAALNHPNICTIHQIEEHEGTKFIVMEYVEGPTLKEILKEGALSLDKTLEYAGQICEAIAAAHDKGIIHRDLKPENIMINEKGQIKVMDFGLAKPQESVDLTKTGSTLGTAPYMSPEQAKGEKVDFQTDIWSFGIILYEILAGKRPFVSEYEHALVYMIINEEHEPANKYREDIPTELTELVDRCLQKEPANRASNIREVLKELKEISGIDSASAFSNEGFEWGEVLKTPKMMIPAGLIILLSIFLIFWYTNRQAKIEWAQNEVIPQIESHLINYEFSEAYQLSNEIRNFIPDASELESLISRSTVHINIETEPAGAEVYAKLYDEPNADWKYIGTTPIENIRLPIDIYRWKIEKDGYETLLAASKTYSIDLSKKDEFFIPINFNRKLDRKGEIPQGMVRIEGVEVYGVKVPDFFIDRYEVTNRQFKEFVDAGGYQNPDYWQHEFIKDGDTLSWEEAMKEFTDQTARNGPATWRAGSYPEGQADYPVTGVSWYEAAAYAEFAGKSLPTTYHWNIARGGGTNWIRFPHFAGGWLYAKHYNFDGKGLLPVGQKQGITSYGVYDMAGNAREWCWNESDRGRILRGGKWNDPVTMYGNHAQMPPFDRSETNGFRTALYLNERELSDRLFEKLTFESEVNAYEKEPASDEVFEVYKQQFEYDEKPFNVEIISRDDSQNDWIHEIVSYDAAYGDERVTAHLFLPNDVEPPFQTMIYFPGAAARYQPNSEYIAEYLDFGNYLEFIVKNGRAVIYPVYKGTFERGFNLNPFVYGNRMTHQYTEYFGMVVKDFKRSLDYLETREDIDMDKIAYYGLSWGAIYGAIIPAVEERLKTSVLVAGGFSNYGYDAVNEISYMPRVKIPTLMINGRYDTVLPYETSIKPMYDLLGSEEKELKLYDADHMPPTNEIIKETLNWLDKYLGPVN